MFSCSFYFFFQAEDGIRDGHVTGVQTCALPISLAGSTGSEIGFAGAAPESVPRRRNSFGTTMSSVGSCLESSPVAMRKIGREACRERGENLSGDGRLNVERQRDRQGEVGSDRRL